MCAGNRTEGSNPSLSARITEEFVEATFVSASPVPGSEQVPEQERISCSRLGVGWRDGEGVGGGLRLLPPSSAMLSSSL
jgi:hypothetical protein